MDFMLFVLKRSFKFLFLLLLSSLPLMALQENDLIIHNRVLAKVNGTTISVMDLMKRMELIFFREFPQYADSLQAKLQFFRASWRTVLDEMIDAELIIANAKEMKMNVSDGDVRQEIEHLFGPNVVVNIDRLGMNYQEAFKMLSNDITVQRMTYGMAHIHAHNRVGPQDIRKAYEQYAKEHPIEESWDYRVISVRAPNVLKGHALSSLCFKMLSQDGIAIDTLTPLLKEKEILTVDTSITTSEVLHRTKKALSEAHLTALLPLQEKTYSEPIVQSSKNNQKSQVFRIFYIEKHTKEGIVPLIEVENLLKNQLLDQAIQEETLAYRKKLRKRFGIDEEFLKMTIPDNFEPFTLAHAGL